MEAVSPQGKVTLPGTFTGWSAFPQVTVNDLLSGSPPSVFLQKSIRGRGPGYLYRVYGQRPLYIGMAFDATIQDRVADHFQGLVTKAGLLPKTQQVKNLAKRDTRRSRSEIEKLRTLVARMGLAGLKVHCGQVTPDSGYRMDPKFLHVFELALQVLGKPSSYVGSARTFE